MSVFTLYLLGGSVPWGFPYAPKCNIGTIVSQTWSGSVDGADLVVKNEARYGASSSFVLERARSIAQRRHTRGAALALIISGNNEFIHLAPRGRIGRGDYLTSAGERRAIIEGHRQNLENAIIELREADVEVVLSTLPANLKDWPPSYTELNANQSGEIECLYEAACEAAGDDKLGEAETLLDAILGMNPGSAQAHFMLGRLLLASGKIGAANTHLVKANDFDGRPIRAISDINQNIRNLANARGVRLLDAKSHFEARASAGVCGFSEFWDDCHPKLGGYVAIADLLGAQIADFTGVEDLPPTPSLAQVQIQHGLGVPFLTDIYVAAGLYCYKHSNCWDSDLTLRRANTYVLNALAISRENVEAIIVLAFIQAHYGEIDGARDQLRAAYRIDPQRVLWLLHGGEASSTLERLGITNLEQWLAAYD